MLQCEHQDAVLPVAVPDRGVDPGPRGLVGDGRDQPQGVEEALPGLQRMDGESAPPLSKLHFLRDPSILLPPPLMNPHSAITHFPSSSMQ